MFNSIPIINLNDWFLSKSQLNNDIYYEKKKKLINDVSYACKEFGFFLIKNHNVSKLIQNDMFDVSKRFFDLPYNQKIKTPMTFDYPYGYENNEILINSYKNIQSSRPIPSQSSPYSDLKETFQFCLGGSKNPLTVLWPAEPLDINIVFYIVRIVC